MENGQTSLANKMFGVKPVRNEHQKEELKNNAILLIKLGICIIIGIAAIVILSITYAPGVLSIFEGVFFIGIFGAAVSFLIGICMYLDSL